jgi:hypothetical protein
MKKIHSMKTTSSGIIWVIILVMNLLVVSCEEKEDYSGIVLKNYLTYEINRAGGFLLTTTEGNKEGDYIPGSKQSYQQSIDEANQVAETVTSSQQQVDLAYKNLLQAGEDFFDHMVPYRSVFQDLIYYAEVTLNSTQEGDQEGNVKSGSKEVLQNAINDADETLSSTELTQRMLDQATTDLTNAIYDFDAAIIGRGLVYIQNAGYELPGYPTTDFNAVDGWDVFMPLESWAPLAGISEEATAPEGHFVARIGSYTQGIYQPLVERLHPNTDYELNFKVGILSNQADWQGKRYKVIILSRIVSFEKEEGNYDFAEVISESYDTLGIDPSGYVEIKQELQIGAASALEGKRIAIDFLQRHTWDPEEQIWAESFVAIDDIKMYRGMK